MRKRGDSFEEIRIYAPGPRACPICAAKHAADQPHDRDSLYYQNRFFMRHRRFPTWEDAMTHCSEKVKIEFTALLAKRGITLDQGGGNG